MESFSGSIAVAIAGMAIFQTALAANGYQFDRSKSYFLAVAGKTGLFSFAGHDHAILANEWSVQENIDPANWKASSVTIRIPVSALVIDSAEARRMAGLGSGPSPNDVQTIQQRMLGPEVLDAPKYPHIEFTSASVEVSGGELRVTGEFRMHGQSHQVTVPVRYTKGSDGGFQFSGNFTVRQTDYGMEPESVGLGTVKVKDEMHIRFQISLKPAG